MKRHSQKIAVSESDVQHMLRQRSACAYIQTSTSASAEMDDDSWSLFDVLKKDLGSHDSSRANTPQRGAPTPAPPVIPTLGVGVGDLVCEACHSTQIVVEDGQNVCQECCLVHSRIIDNGAEWRYYGVDDSRGEDPTRCGMPVNDLLPGSSLGSMVGGNRYDNRDMSRIRQFQMWNSMPYWERELYRVFEKLSSATTNNGIPTKVLHDSKVLYSRASEMKISRGENKEGLIASCIFYACAMNGVPRSTTEIAQMFNIHPTVLTKGNSRFQALMKLNIQSPNAVDFISRFASQLRMNWSHIEECQELTMAIENLEIVSENAPTSVAAGTLYYYCMMKEMDIPKKQIATICNVSEVTITKCYKNLLKYKAHIEAEFAHVRET
jgi:transcription initiation factor TFIIB